MLQTLKQETELVFSDFSEKKPPSIPYDITRRLKAFKEANLTLQHEQCLWQTRCWQAEEIGFKEVKIENMVKELTGVLPEKVSNASDYDARATCRVSYDNHAYEWSYNHNKNLVEKLSIYPGLYWSYRPLRVCMMGSMDYLNREIPYGVVLRINELKKLNLFNCFHAIAPIELWHKAVNIDPIIVGDITRFGFGKSEELHKYYFIAQW